MQRSQMGVVSNTSGLTTVIATAPIMLEMLTGITNLLRPGTYHTKAPGRRLHKWTMITVCGNRNDIIGYLKGTLDILHYIGQVAHISAMPTSAVAP